MPDRTRSFTLAELAQLCGGEILGAGGTRVSGISDLIQAGPGEISFLSDPRRRRELEHTRAAAVIVGPAARDATALPRLVNTNPYACYARVSALFNPPPPAQPGIAASAVVHESARVAPSASIGAGAVIENNVVVGERTVIGAGCTIGDSAQIGADCRLYPRVSVYHGCRIGDRAIIHCGAVIGADGFGFAHDDGRWVKIPQIGGVLVGNDVEIGANTTIDRGALQDTVIGDGVKLDNLIQIAHNVVIGEHSAIAACVGIAGSAKIGRHCTIGGAAGVLGHLEVADGTRIQAMTLVTRTLAEAGTYSSAIPCSPSREWMKTLARLRRLAELEQRLCRLEDAHTKQAQED